MIAKNFLILFRDRKLCGIFTILFCVVNLCYFKTIVDLCYSNSILDTDGFLGISIMEILSYPMFYCFLACVSLFFNKYEKKFRQINLIYAADRTFFIQSIIMISILCIFIINFCLWNIIVLIVSQNFHMELLSYILQYIGIYIFLPCLLSIILGYMLAKVKNRGLQLFCYLLICFFLSPLTDTISESISTPQFNIYSVFEVLSMLPQYPDWSYSQYTGPMLSKYKLIQMLCCLVISFVLCRFLSNYRKRNILLAVVLIPMLLILTGKQPWGYRGGFDPERTVAGHIVAYYANESEHKNEDVYNDFQVDKYLIKMRITNKLSASADMTVSNTRQNQYAFTLYHQYIVNAIHDEKGNDLDYVQTGDYIYINNVDEVERIVIEYEGSSPGFYAYDGGVYLPGYFPYYPRAGIHDVYDYENREWVADDSQKEAYYDVSVESSCKIVTNLIEHEGGNYQGYSKECTILGGYFDSVNYRDVRVILPKYGIRSINTNDNICKCIDQMFEIEKENNKNNADGYTIAGKTLFIEAGVGGERMYYFTSDYAMVEGLNVIKESGTNLNYYYQLDDSYSNFLISNKNCTNHWLMKKEIGEIQQNE